MEHKYNDEQAICLERLTTILLSGRRQWTGNDPLDSIGLSDSNYIEVLTAFEARGIISNWRRHGPTPNMMVFNIEPKAMDELQKYFAWKKERPDLIDGWKQAARKNRFFAYTIAIGAVMVIAITIIRGVIGIAKDLGWMK